MKWNKFDNKLPKNGEIVLVGSHTICFTVSDDCKWWWNNFGGRFTTVCHNKSLTAKDYFDNGWEYWASIEKLPED